MRIRPTSSSDALLRPRLKRHAGAMGLALAVLANPMAGSVAPARAEPPDFFFFLRPPAAVPQPSRNWNGWRPDTLRPQKQQKQQRRPVQAAPSQQQAPTVRRRAAPPPAVARIEEEPEGILYASADAAIEGKRQPPTQFILVLGDHTAEQLAHGLADIYVDERSRAVIGRSEDESGFLPTPVDWMGKLPDAVTKARPSVTVLALGGADLEPIKDGVGFAEPLTERWLELYSRRVDEVLAALRDRAGRVIVVGLAPVANAQLSTEYGRLNEVLRTRSARAGVTFTSVWDGFVDEEGKYIASGPAVDGQRRRLRLNDGVRFTRAGARKLAFFVQKDVNRLLADPAKVAPTAALSLSGGPSGAKTLAGATPVAFAGKPGDAMQVLLEGQPLAPVRGRADDFAWPPPEAPVAAAPAAGGESGEAAH